MDPATRSNREKKRIDNQEEIKHLLEEIWYFYLDETFYKILSREAKKVIQDIIDMTKEGLKELSWRKNNGDLSELITIEVGKVRSLRNYNTCLNFKGNLPFEAR